MNRVFDSSGPQGKVRGTPQQIAEKYVALADDAQLAGDRVAAESFTQHSEHYSRMLAAAMKEQAERQAEHQKHQQAQQQQAQQAREQQQQQQQQPVVEKTVEVVTDDQPPMAAIEMDKAADIVVTPESNVSEKPKRRTRTKQAAPKAVEKTTEEAPAAD